jgi:nitroreductase
MDALLAILSRRSIRKYTAQALSAKTVQTLLEAAMAAPSANNTQPWHFVVVTERATLTTLAAVLPHGQMLKQAPLAIAVCAEVATDERTWVQDCSAATENILVAAQALGLGGVWLGVYPREERVAGVAQALCLPAGVTPLCVLSLGYPAEEKGPAGRYDATRVHHETW